MKMLVLAAMSAAMGLLAAGSAAAAAAAAAPGQLSAPGSPYLRGAQCLNPEFARGWVVLDDRHILVDAGRKRYQIEFRGYCWDIAQTPVIGFRGDPISGRVCGGPFDSVLTRDVSCSIQRMDLISREEYKSLETQRARDRAARKLQRRLKS